MARLLIGICAILLLHPAASSAGPRFGIEGGGSLVWTEFGYEFNDQPIDADPRLDFNAAATVHFVLSPSWGLTTGLRYSRLGDQGNTSSSTITSRQQYLGVPLLARLSFGGDRGPFLFGGAEAAWLIEAAQDIEGKERDTTDYLKRYNVTAVIGAGIEIGVGDHSLEIALRYGYGLTDIVNHDEFPTSVTKQKTRELALTLGFRL